MRVDGVVVPFTHRSEGQFPPGADGICACDYYKCDLCDYEFAIGWDPLSSFHEQEMQTNDRIRRHLDFGHPDWRELNSYGEGMSQREYAVKLTKPEIFHVQACLDDREREGCYYGNPEQFWERHSRILVKLLHRMGAEAFLRRVTEADDE